MRSFLFNCLFFSVTLSTAAVALVAAQFGGVRTMRWFQARHCRNILLLTRVILGVRVEIRGRERLPADGPPALIVSKHQSELDVFPMVSMFPDVAAIAMAELENYPLIGPALRKLGHIMVYVEGARRNQTAQVVDGARRVRAEGRPILIYPEGELMRIGARERYRAGVFHIYEAIGEPATPVAVCTGLAWPRRAWRKNPGQRCVIEFMEPIPPGFDRETFMLEIERRIEAHTMTLLRELGSAEQIAEAERRHQLGATNSDDPATRRPPIPGLTGADAAANDDGSAGGQDEVSARQDASRAAARGL